MSLRCATVCETTTVNDETPTTPPTNSEESELMAMQLDTGTFGYAIGEIRSDVRSLSSTVDEIKEDLKQVDGDVRSLWKWTFGAGTGICMAGLAAAVWVYTQLDAEINQLRTETTAQLEKLDTDAEALKEQLTELKISTTESLSSVQSSLGEITLKIDGLASADDAEKDKLKLVNRNPKPAKIREPRVPIVNIPEEG